MTYTVKPGDTLYGISNQFGVSVTELASLNNVKANTLQIGQVLKIPSRGGTNPNNMFMYTVKPGDTLYSIAQRYNTSVGSIIDLNDLNSNLLKVGDVLRIPEMYTPPANMNLPAYTNYVVKNGDTLYRIARNNNVSVDTIMKDNGLTSANLSIGKVLRIRTNEINVNNALECYGEDFISNDNNTGNVYIVKKGDNLYNIAKKYNTNVEVIKKKNNLTSNNLSIGQKLFI